MWPFHSTSAVREEDSVLLLVSGFLNLKKKSTIRTIQEDRINIKFTFRNRQLPAAETVNWQKLQCVLPLHPTRSFSSLALSITNFVETFLSRKVLKITFWIKL